MFGDDSPLLKDLQVPWLPTKTSVITWPGRSVLYFHQGLVRQYNLQIVGSETFVYFGHRYTNKDWHRIWTCFFSEKNLVLGRVRLQVPAVRFGGVYTLGYDQIYFLFATFQVNVSGIQKLSYPLCSTQNLETSQEIWKQYFCQGADTDM